MTQELNFKLKIGLDIPISGAIKDQTIYQKQASRVAIVGPDFAGMKPTLQVGVGDSVKSGQVLFSCKKNIGLQFCSRFSGVVEDIHRGEKRAFESLVIRLDSNQAAVSFKSAGSPDSMSTEQIRALLIESGEWASLRQRPFDKVASVNATPESILVTATDTNPLAIHPKFAIEKWPEEFATGLRVLSKLADKKTYVCFPGDYSTKVPDSCEVARFSGPHPSGSVGTHIHFLQPVTMERLVWHVGYQDVIAIGHLFMTGRLMADKLVGLAGPCVRSPKILEAPRGGKISELIQDEFENGRVISGSVLHGRHATESFDYLGWYHNAISVIEEDSHREFLGWQKPGLGKFSSKPIFVSRLLRGKLFAMGSSTHGSPRAMVPIGMFENVMPMDILPTQLLRALVSRDVETAQDLGCLELAEEDLALCTFVSPGKVDFGPILRDNLNIIEREG